VGTDLAGFLLLSVALTVTPGPDDVLVLRCSAGGGLRCAVAAALGVAVGSLGWGAATVIGLAGAVATPGPAYVALRLGGAVYLVALGVSGLVGQAGRRRSPRPGACATGRARMPGGVRSAFAAGVLSDLLNPKIGMFYVAVLPQFVPDGRPVLGWLLLLCLIDVVVALSWLVVVAWMADAALGWLRRPVVDRWLQGGLSASLIGIGVAVCLAV
jgi:threonine/homoserine/homoserine lactone efflux protein